MVCCALMALVISSGLYLARALIPRLRQAGHADALGWRLSGGMREQADD